MSIVIRERGLGANIALVFSIIARNFPKLALVSLIFGLPGLLPQLMAAMSPDGWLVNLGEIFSLDDALWIDGAAILGSVLTLLFLPLLIGSIIGIVTGSYTGENVTVGKSIGLAGRHFFSLALFGFLSYLAMGLGFMLLIIPGVILLTMFYVGAPAIVAENLGPGQAFFRSVFLSKGSRLSILAFLVLLSIICWLFAAIFMTPILLVSGLDGLQETSLVMVILTWVVNSLAGLLNTVAPVVMYFQTRAKREGFLLTSVADLVDRIEQRRSGPDVEGGSL